MGLGFALKRIASLAAALLLFAAGACAQGCAMCYTSAAAQGPQGVRALNLGILILLIPTVAIFGGIFWLAYHYRDPWAAREAARRAGPGTGSRPGAGRGY